MSKTQQKHCERSFGTNILVLGKQSHRMMGKTQQTHCEQSFGTNVLVLGKQSRHLSLVFPTSKKDDNKNVVIEQVLY